MYDISNRSSFENIPKLFLREIGYHNPATPIILCGAKMDLRMEFNKNSSELSSNFISNQEGVTLAEKINAFAFIEVSSKNQENMKNVIDACVYSVLANRGMDLMPSHKNNKNCAIS